MSHLPRAAREAAFALTVAEVTAIAAWIPMSSTAAPLFYVAIPVACVMYLNAGNIKVGGNPLEAASSIAFSLCHLGSLLSATSA